MNFQLLKNLIILSFLVFTVLGSKAFARKPQTVDFDDLARQVFNPDHLEEIIKLSDELMEICPPATCQVISLGRSPTPFVEYLNIVNPGSTRILPFGSFRFNPHITNLGLTDKKVEKLFEYFDKHLMPKLAQEKKTVMLLDFAMSSGRSLVSAQAYIDLYFKDRGVKRDLRSTFIADQMLVPTLEQAARSYRVEQPYFLKLDKTLPLGMTLRQQAYDSFAKYESFILIDHQGNVNPDDPKLNRSYARKALKKHLVKGMLQYRSRMIKQCLLQSEEIYLGN